MSRQAAAFDTSRPLRLMIGHDDGEATSDCAGHEEGCGSSSDGDEEGAQERVRKDPPAPRMIAVGAEAEQTSPGARPPMAILDNFDGLGFGFTGPQGTASLRNPSDNTLAVGPNHIVQIVNSRMAVFTKKGKEYDATGKVLYGPVRTNAIFDGFGGQCETQNSGDSVVRYDQLAERWLYVLPIFRRPPGEPNGPYYMCYAVSAGPDPLGPYHRYAFERPLFPDYPRPAIWPDGYYIPSSTGDNVIQKHACVADRNKMLQGLPATEQCVIVEGVNFLNNADIDGSGLPPPGAPNIMLAAGGAQLKKNFEDDGIYAYQFHVDWENTSNTKVSDPVKIKVAPYHYLCDGQLTSCVPQPGTDRRLDAQGDKLMQRLVYRNLGSYETLAIVHSINTKAEGGGVRWYEFRLDKDRKPYLFQQSTYAPDKFFRWMGSIGIDRQGDLGVGYSFGGAPNFAGQRFAGRLASDPPGSLTFRETTLVEGAASQTNTLRWEDYTTTAMDPSDDCTFWYVGDYLKAGDTSYRTRIGAFRAPGCLQGTLSGSTYFDLNHNGRRDTGEPGLAGFSLRYSGGGTGKLTTDSAGTFKAPLPADPAYGEPVYTVAVESSPNRFLRQTNLTMPTDAAGTVTTAQNSYTVHLTDKATVANLDFGSACTVRNRDGKDASYWTKSREKANPKFAGLDWQAVLGSKLYLVKADGSPFTLNGSNEENADQFRKWLRESTKSNPAAALSHQVAVTALNIAAGTQRGDATIQEPTSKNWVAINAFLGQASEAIQAHQKSSAAETASNLDQYRVVLEKLNRNRLEITPADPEKCKPSK